MERDPEQRYDIYFAGECLEGSAPDVVQRAVAALFRADAETLARLFSGKRQRIKRDCDEATARQYVAALRKAGARAIVVAAHSDDAEGSAGDAPGAREGTATAGLSLAPPGSEVLTADERPVIRGATVATDHLSLAAPGTTLSPPAPAAPARPEGPDYELAPAGSTLNTAAAKPAPEPPDTSGLALREGELDLSDCAAPRPPPPALDLSRITLAAPGSAVLESPAQSPAPAAAPDTSHLTLELDDDHPS